MKKFDVKSLAAGIIIGTMGVTTVFAASGIQSANLSNTTVTLHGVSLSISHSLFYAFRKLGDYSCSSSADPCFFICGKLYSEKNLYYVSAAI